MLKHYFLLVFILLRSSCGHKQATSEGPADVLDSCSLTIGHHLVYPKFYKDHRDEEFGSKEYHIMIQDTQTGKQDSISINVDSIDDLLPGESDRYVLLTSISGSGSFCNIYKLDLQKKDETMCIVKNKSNTEKVYPTSTGFNIDRIDYDTNEPITEVYDFNGKMVKVVKRTK